MANALVLVRGSTSITLTDEANGYKLLSYAPRSPAFAPEQMASVLSGVWLHEKPPTVSESAVIMLSKSTAVTAKAAINAIEQMLSYAAPMRHQLNTGDRVYVRFTPDSGSAYQSEIIGGGIDYDADAFRRTFWTAGHMRITLAWERRYYWESTSLAAVSIGTSGVADSASTQTIQNLAASTGGALVNWIQIAASAIAQNSIPAAYQMEFASVSPVETIGSIYIGHQLDYGNAMDYTPALEAEGAASINSLYATSAIYLNRSGAGAVNASIYSSSTASLMNWRMGAASANISPYVKPMAVFRTAPSNCTIQLRWTLLNQGVMAQSDYATLTTCALVQPLPTIRLQPLVGTLSTGSWLLRLDARDSASNGTFSLDWIDLMPVGDGHGFRHVHNIDDAQNAGATCVIDDQTEGLVYGASAGSAYGLYTVHGGPILLSPSQLQRLHFVWTVLSTCPEGASPIARANVALWYKQRTLTI